MLNNPFASYWMGGYECADHQNAFGNRVDLLTATGHIGMLGKDYRALAPFNIKTVREGIRWSMVEKTPYVYDWSIVRDMIQVAKHTGIQQVWDLCHFGFPDDLTPLHPMFARRFAALCKAFVSFYRTIDPDGTLIITPINEVSFLSWLGGDVRGTSPYCIKLGFEVKYALVKAYIEGIQAIRDIDDSVRILTTEPLVNIVAPFECNEEERLSIEGLNDAQFQVTDMLCGRLCPELGGQPEYLDIIGYNYYYNNQWEARTNLYLDWLPVVKDSRFLPLHQLLTNAYGRYDKPIVLTETSHPLEDRPRWLAMVASECDHVVDMGIPLWGICWYPMLNRPDWDHLHQWHYSGIWDDVHVEGSKSRVLHEETADLLKLIANSRFQQTAALSSVEESYY